MIDCDNASAGADHHVVTHRDRSNIEDRYIIVGEESVPNMKYSVHSRTENRDPSTDRHRSFRITYEVARQWHLHQRDR